MVNTCTRQASEADVHFLFELHRQALSPYVEQTWGWDEAWQRDHLRKRFSPVTSTDIVIFEGCDVGCIRVQELESWIFLDYVALLPEYQGNGLGTHLVRGVMQSAASKGLPVRLNVLRVNPAKELYERLGFRVVGGAHIFSLWRHRRSGVPQRGLTRHTEKLSVGQTVIG